MTREQRIADRMKEARRLAGLSQEETGRRLGVTLRTYARWERGETQGFLGHIGEIAKVLGTTPDDLLGGEIGAPAPTVDELSAKVETVLVELQRLRVDLGLDGGAGKRPRSRR